jgi:hypothetical protein
MIRLRDHYDWAVLGDHPGALLSGCLAARLGLSVLIVPLFEGASSMVSHSEQVFDPESNFLLGLGRLDRASGLLGECLIRLGIQGAESDQVLLDGALPQVLTPEARVQFSSDEAAFALEMDREFEKDNAARAGLIEALSVSSMDFAQFWLKLPERLTLVPSKTQKPGGPLTGSTHAHPLSLDEVRKRLTAPGVAARNWFHSAHPVSWAAREMRRPDFRETGAGLWYGLAGTLSADPKMEELLALMGAGRTGATFRGGMTAYRELLLRMARRLGAHIPEKAECRRIFVEAGRFVGIQVASRGNMISVGGGVLGCALSQARDRFSISGKAWNKKLRNSPVPSGWKFSLSLTVHKEAVPPGATRRMIWQEPDSPVLEIELADPGEYGVRDSGSHLVFLRTILPFEQKSLELPYLRLMAARMLRKATELLPFLEFHVVRIFPDFRKEDAGPEGQDELSEAYGFALPGLIPENLRAYATPGVGSFSGIDGLFVATGESFPELGSLGGTVAALESAAWLAHRSGLAGPFV